MLPHPSHILIRNNRSKKSGIIETKFNSLSVKNPLQYLFPTAFRVTDNMLESFPFLTSTTFKCLREKKIMTKSLLCVVNVTNQESFRSQFSFPPFREARALSSYLPLVDEGVYSSCSWRIIIIISESAVGPVHSHCRISSHV